MRSFQKKLMVAAACAATVGAFGVAWAQSTDSSSTTADTTATAPVNGNMSGDAQSMPQAAPAGNSPDMSNLNYPNDSSTVPNDASSPDTSATPAAPATSSTDNSSTDNADATMPAPRADRN